MMGLMLAVVLSVWGCGEGNTHTQPTSNAEDANPKATATELITASELESSSVPEGEEEDEQEEEPDEQEETEEPEEQEEDEMGEDPDPEVRSPAADFNYEEWTAESPTLGKPKVPGPPYPYLEENSRRGLYDLLRKFRWAVWIGHRSGLEYYTAALQWYQNWDDWKDSNEFIAFGREFARLKESSGGRGRWNCRVWKDHGLYFPLRKNDRGLESLSRRMASALEHQRSARQYQSSQESSVLPALLGLQGEIAAREWLTQVKALSESKWPPYAKAYEAHKAAYAQRFNLHGVMGCLHAYSCYKPYPIQTYPECTKGRTLYSDHKFR